MAVNLAPPVPASLHPVAGVELGVAMAGIRKPGRRDLLVMRLSAGSAASGVFTRNRFCAAPVILAKRHLAAAQEVRALVVNTGNANAGTGSDGLERALAVCRDASRSLGCAVEQVLPFSTGVIMEPLPVERVLAGLPAALTDLREDNWHAAAQAIMTTDTMPKAISRRLRLGGREVTITGIAKGAGMIRPDMATMLAFVATDAKVGHGDLDAMVGRVAERSFNCITVDGDTSTNDAFMLIASGASGALVPVPRKNSSAALRNSSVLSFSRSSSRRLGSSSCSRVFGSFRVSAVGRRASRGASSRWITAVAASSPASRYTACPPVDTLCPAVNTQCPAVNTQCPPAATQCAFDSITIAIRTKPLALPSQRLNSSSKAASDSSRVSGWRGLPAVRQRSSFAKT